MSDHDARVAMSRRLFLGTAASAGLLGGLTLPAGAHSYSRNGLFIGHLWSPTGNGTDLPVYGPILNREAADDALIAAHCAMAKSVRFVRTDGGHDSVLDQIPLPAGQPTTLAAWTTHIVLAGLTKPVAAGAWVPVTLVFRRAGTFEVKTIVQARPDH